MFVIHHLFETVIFIANSEEDWQYTRNVGNFVNYINYNNSFVLGMIISMPFLLVTFLVYLLLPDRNLHQKALMFYVLALFFAYILLVTINLSQNISDPWCSVVGTSLMDQ